MKRITEYSAPVVIIIRCYENSKDMSSKVLGEILHDNVTSVEEVTEEDAEEYEADFLDDELHSDRYGEYLVLHFTFGADVVYRLNDVDWEVGAV